VLIFVGDLIYGTIVLGRENMLLVAIKRIGNGGREKRR
jgi:hypothetical protein